MMRSGLFCLPKTDSGTAAAQMGQDFRDRIDFGIEAEAVGFHSSFSVILGTIHCARKETGAAP